MTESYAEEAVETEYPEAFRFTTLDGLTVTVLLSENDGGLKININGISHLCEYTSVLSFRERIEKITAQMTS